MTKTPEGLKTTWAAPNIDFVLVTLTKYRWLIGGATAIALVAAAITVLLLPRYYEVSASLLFKLGREIKPPATVSMGDSPVVTGRRPEDVISEIEIMKSQTLLERLIDHFGEDFFFAEPEPQTFFQAVKAFARKVVRKAKEMLQEAAILLGFSKRLSRRELITLMLQYAISIDVAPKSDVISLRMVSSSPEGGELILSKFIELYQQEHIDAYKTPRAKEFFETQVQELSHQLTDAEQKKAFLKEKDKVWSLDNQRQLLLSQHQQVTASQAETQGRMTQLRTEISSLEKHLSGLPRELQLSRTVERNPLADVLRKRLAALEENRERLRGKYSDDSRTVTDLVREIETLRQTLQKEETLVTQSVTSGLNQNFRDAEKEVLNKKTELDGLETQITEQGRRIATIEAELRNIDAAEVDLRRLDRQIALLEQNYSLYAKNLEEARISEAMDIASLSNVTVISPPAASVLPISPRKRIIFVGALLLGLGGSIAAVFIFEALYPAVHSRDDITEILDAPVLATIPEARA